VDTIVETVRATRRRHSAALKSRILEACAQPGASVARIALENGLNANLVHKWRSRAGGSKATTAVVAAGEFMSLPIAPAAMAPPAGGIRISIRHGDTTLDIQWPVSSAESCAQWLCELMR
jgi:transposase